jgi:hypothetical protein
MNTTCRLALISAGCLLLRPKVVWAGMAAPLDGDVVDSIVANGFTENAIARLQNLSFFLAGFLLSALLVKLLWNWLRKDWTFLPRLTYAKSLGVVFLWGLVFVLVLTMISGARELMTPGAWEKQGLTYKLSSPKSDSTEMETLDKKREQQLMQIRDALWEFAKQHQGDFPNDLAAAGISKESLRVPDPSAMNYFYINGLKANQGDSPLLCEPAIFGPKRFVLFTSGKIRQVPTAEFQETSVPVTP